ncbi:MAG TPA: hypothetical protein VK013_09020 [Myxococcaceae bacterium]|nr:hypothetical protein [Myxococcaceae bacterium]
MIRKTSLLSKARQALRRAEAAPKPTTRRGATEVSSFSRSRPPVVALQDPGPAPARTPRATTEAAVARATEAETRLRELSGGGADAATLRQIDHAQTQVSERWREAGVAAAQELEAYARSGASIPAIEARSEALRGISEHPSYAAGMDEARAASAQARAVEASVAEVEAAFEEGGAPEAATALREAVESAPSPEAARAIMEANQEHIDRVVEALGDASGGTDGSQFGLPNEAQVRFDQTVADLGLAAELAGRAPGGDAVIERLAGQLAEVITDRGIGRFDEALGNTLLGGNAFDRDGGIERASSALTMEVIRQLAANGESGTADDILQNVEASTAKHAERLEDLTSSVDAHNADLARLIQDWGPMMGDEELQAAIDAFRDSHPAYAELEAYAGPALELLNGVHALPPGVSGLDHAEDLSARLNDFIERVPDALNNVENGHASVDVLLASGDTSILDRIADVAEQVDDKAGYLEKAGKLLLNHTVEQALAASGTGDLQAVERALASLNRQAGVFGLSPTQMETLTSELGELATASSPEEAAEAMERMNSALDDLRSEGPFSAERSFGLAFRTAGVVLGAIATADAVGDFLDEQSLENAIGVLSNASGLGTSAVELASSVTRNVSLLKGGAATTFKVAGQVAGALGAGLSTYEAALAFEAGDPAKGSLHMAQAAGAVIALAGSTGVGLAIAAGAGIALVQLDRVRASNVMENGHTQAFLEAAGLSSDVTYHLRNADSGGRSVGPVLNAIAEHLGVEPRDFLQAVGQLSPDEVLLLVEAAHGVDPDDEGRFRIEADSDARVGTPQPHLEHQLGGLEAIPPHLQVRPESIAGLVRFIEANGLDLPTS